MGQGASLRCFAPLATSNSTILILGSMPGAASLEACEYYAHPRNAFWKIMQQLLGVGSQAPYEERVHTLQLRGIALWDVLHSCNRTGSLDAAIARDSVAVNDFSGFLASHCLIRRLLFNGAAAFRYFERCVVPALTNQAIERRCMPSTSPANAALSLEQKTAAWRIGLFARR